MPGALHPKFNDADQFVIRRVNTFTALRPDLPDFSSVSGQCLDRPDSAPAGSCLGYSISGSAFSGSARTQLIG